MNLEDLLKEIESLRIRASELEDTKARLVKVGQAILDSEERFRRFYDAAPLGCMSLDEEGRIVDVNSAWLKTLGYSREDVIGHWFGDFLAPGHQERFNVDFPGCMIRGEIHWPDYDMLRKDRSTVSLALDGNVGRDQSAGLKQIHCVIHDLTELKRSRQELKERQDRLSLALDGASLGIWDWDLKAGRAFWTARAFGMLGYEANEFEPNLKNWKRLVHPEDWPRVSENLNIHIQGKAPTFETEYRIQDKSGNWRWTQVKGSVVEYDESRKPMRMTGIVIDITDRKKAERALSESEQRYRTLVEDSFDGIFLQRGTKIVFANRALHDMLGYEPGELVGKDHWIIYHPEDQPMTRARAQARLRGKSVQECYEVRLQSKEGTVLDGEIRAKAFFFEEEPGIQVWVRDISEQKRSKEKFQTLIENVPFGTVIIEEDGTYSYLSPQVVEMFGYAPEEIPDGSTWMRKAYPDPDYRRKVICNS